MTYNLCKCCRYFQPVILTEERRWPNHCTNQRYANIFGKSHGFPSGIDIIHCDDFAQWPIDYGDTKILVEQAKNLGVSYVLKAPRKFLEKRICTLYDNKQNIQTLNLTDL
jgi:hypothetical protein